LKKIPREEISEVLIDKANKHIDSIDLELGRELLQPGYGMKMALAWLRKKFDIALDYEAVRHLESTQFMEKLQKLTHEKYREKEIQFPVLGGLYHFTVEDAQGRRYNREGLVDWARARFAVNLDVEDLKSKQRHEIEAIMFAQSRHTSDHVPDIYKSLRERLDALLLASGVDPETIRRELAELVAKTQASGKVSAGSKFAARSVTKQPARYTGKYASNRVAGADNNIKNTPTLKNNPELREFCDWANSEFANGPVAPLSPEMILSWEIVDIEDRLSSLIEDRFNPEMRKMERALVLQILDTIWKDHLLVMDHLRSSIGLRGYAQIDPKVEFKREGMRIFGDMWNSIYSRVTDLIFRMEQLDPGFVRSTWQETEAVHEEVAAGSALSDFAKQQTDSADSVATSDKKQEPIRNKTPEVGRNDLCPCGSGKKYKKCCMKS
ncbi:MAG: SEC-C metal-binding domain-containing protein, partial [Thermoguttaceae bacterium]